MSKSIHTIDSRENLELLTVAAFFGIQSDAMHSLISDWHDLLEAELQSEGIDYRELKAALVPAKKKREAALIFDTAAIPDAWYPLPVFEKLLQYLDRKSVNSVLMGDFIERSSPGCLQRCLEETGSRIDTDGTHDHFIVYLNNLSKSDPANLDRHFREFAGYRGIADLSYGSVFKTLLSTMLIPGFIKVRDTVIMEAEYDYAEWILDKKKESLGGPANPLGFPFAENGFRTTAISQDLYGIFLSYKIERECDGMDEADQLMGLNSAPARDTGISSSKRISYHKCRPYRRRLSAKRPPSRKTRRTSVAPSAAATSSISPSPVAASPRVNCPVRSASGPSSESFIRIQPLITSSPSAYIRSPSSGSTPTVKLSFAQEISNPAQSPANQYLYFIHYSFFPFSSALSTAS